MVQVKEGTWLARAYGALDRLDAVSASREDIIEAIKIAWLPDEPTEMRTLVGLFYKTNTTDVPDEVWILVGDDGRRNTKKSPNPKPDRWKQIGTYRYIE